MSSIPKATLIAYSRCFALMPSAVASRSALQRAAFACMDCLGVASSDRLLVVSNPPQRRIAMALLEAARTRADVVHHLVDAGVHVDAVLLTPTIHLDDVPLIVDGETVRETLP